MKRKLKSFNDTADSADSSELTDLSDLKLSPRTVLKLKTCPIQTAHRIFHREAEKIRLSSVNDLKEKLLSTQTESD